MANFNSRRPLLPGVYAPLPTFFDDNQELDYETYKAHLLSMKSTKFQPLGLQFFFQIFLIFPRFNFEGDGSSQYAQALSVKPFIWDAGMVILPAYYAASLNTDPEQVIQYYIDICAGSPIPLLLYNFPANAGGQDMSSEVISTIIKKALNFCGVKLICGGSIGKLVRLKELLSEDPMINSSRKFPFLLLDGLIADLTPWMQCGGHETVSGIPNFAPRASMRLWHLLNLKSPTPEELQEATRIQAILSRADASAVPGGIRAMKYALNKMHGYGIAPRKPLLPLNESEGEKFMEVLKEMLELENEFIEG
ncbi:hypothetical protein N7488_002637 [Penicillium malachiteum]|nr:hypothetical protein N7488_002637 [Penicillium malachiteum]